jgi:hypothetical protein
MLLRHGDWPKTLAVSTIRRAASRTNPFRSLINPRKSMRGPVSLWSLLIAVAVAGCGSSDTIWVKGVLQKGGEVYKPPDGRKLALYFHPMKSDTPGNTASEIEMADYDPRDGTFTVPGRQGNGIAPGKYRIAVVETLRRAERDKLNKTAKPRRGEVRINNDTNFLEGQFGENTSPFVRELTTSTALTLDMAKPTE